MKKSLLLSVLILIALGISASAFGQWAVSYSGPEELSDAATSIQQTADGGYIVAGWVEERTDIPTKIYYSLWILKLHANGTVAWEKCRRQVYTARYSVRQTRDGGYILAGVPDFVPSFDVTKLHADGTFAWRKAYSTGTWEEAHCIEMTVDGGYILTGTAESDIWTLRLTGQGYIVWQKMYGGDSREEVRSIQQTVDGGYVLAGTTESFGAGGSDIWVLKLDGNGSVSWQKAYGGSSSEEVESIQQTADGGYVVAGTTWSFGAGFTDIWVLKLNANGSVSWQKTYGGSSGEQGGYIQQTADGGYIVAGTTWSFGAGASDIWVLKLNGNGSVAWQKTYGGSNSNESFSSMDQTTDGGYIVAGGNDMWVLKLNGNGEIPDCPIVSDGAGVVSNTSAVITNTTDVPRDSYAEPVDLTASFSEVGVETSIICGEACVEDDYGSLDIKGSSGSLESTVTVTIRIQDAPNHVGALGFEVDFSEAPLNFSGYSRGPLVENFDYFDAVVPGDAPGVVRVGGFKAEDGISAGESGDLVYLDFKVERCDPGARYPLGLGALKDDMASWSFTGGCFQCGCSCDVSGDGQITPREALCCFQKYLGRCPTDCGACDSICCDVNTDGDCTPADALEIFKAYLGLPSLCPP